MSGRSIPWNDAFKIGRKKSSEDICENTRPRPLLVKISSERDKRLLLSSRYKLKEYQTAKIFLREDLPLEVRKEHPRQRQVYRERSNPPPQDT